MKTDAEWEEEYLKQISTRHSIIRFRSDGSMCDEIHYTEVLRDDQSNIYIKQEYFDLNEKLLKESEYKLNEVRNPFILRSIIRQMSYNS